MKAASIIETAGHPTNDQLCAIARTYILEEHARVGDRIYYWDNWNISVGANSSASEPTLDNDTYSWATTLSCDITNIEVSERNDSEQEYLVTVAADITVGSGSNSNGAEVENQEIEHEKHVFFCYVKSIQGEYFVTSVEE
ncbi:MAG: hypothetical protein KME29_34890 [Calothrix sp. FI2-JRJ7]|jgi:hypothetical protein|nr:hypothetical protein [Calothrix sp. FI2-JRJ7]